MDIKLLSELPLPVSRKSELEVNECLVTVGFDSRLTHDQCEATGRRSQWILVESNQGYLALVDVYDGWLALVKDNKLLGVGKDSVVTKEAVMINKDYYSSDSYIYFPSDSNKISY